MSLQQRRTESKHVSKRVQQTKREIEQLESELQKLISRGIRANENAANGELQMMTTSIEIENQIDKKFPRNDREIISPPKITTKPYALKPPQRQKSTEPEPRKKERHYNVEEAREYMRKQKEKRLKSQAKQTGDAGADLRKEKLRELQAKSLQLVKKNVEKKREKSKSRENLRPQPVKVKFREVTDDVSLPLSRNHFDANGCLVPDLIVNNIKHLDGKQSRVPVQEDDGRIIHPHFKNITIRHAYDLEADVPKLQPPKRYGECYDFRHTVASIKIQAAYRGYRQKKLYNATIKMKRQLKENARKLAEDALKRQSTNASMVGDGKKEIPFWLETVSKPYPYSFISAVKRKLNFSTKAPIKTYSDVAVQSCVNVATAANSAETINFLSRKNLDLNLEGIERLQLQIKSDANGCDIEEGSVDKSGLAGKTKPSKQNALVSIESSGSDTSKNIPDISSESLNNLHSSKTGQSASSLRINVDGLKHLRLHKKLHNGLVENVLQNASERSITRRGRIKTNKFEERPNGQDNISLAQLDPAESRMFLSEPENHKTSSHSSAYDKSNSTKSKLYLNQEKENDFDINLKDIRSKSVSGKLEDLVDNSTKPSSKTSQENLKLSNRVEISSANNSTDSKKLPSQPESGIETDPIALSESFKTLLGTVPNSVETYSPDFSNAISSVPSLKRPTDTLTTSNQLKPREPELGTTDRIITLQPGEATCFETKTNTNQIHLKFEAELHLLNDFNESLRQFMAVEKSLLELQTKNQGNTVVYQHQDTQTSAPLQSAIEGNMIDSSSTKKPIPTINYSRGSDVTDDTTLFGFGNSFLHATDKSLLTTGLELSQIDESMGSTLNDTNYRNILQGNDSYGGNIFAGLSLGMFDQLIKDEDSRIENLKTILKIREKALLDRTKGELAWLEIQKKQLIETGQLHEASLLKKKQRGIVIKLQHEKQEMQRLKQMQKAASKERKTILKEQRNMIKAQLSSGSVVTKIKRNSVQQKSRQRTGPVRVYNLHRETVNTETSLSKRNSAAEELVITSLSESTVSRISDCDFEFVAHNSTMKKNFSQRAERTKQFLLMKEAALQKRRKAAEDLLQWHQRLLEEERKIAELEMAANTIINQVPNPSVDNVKNSTKEKYTTTSGQLNSWLNVKRTEPKLRDENDPGAFSGQVSKSSKKHAKQNKNLLANNIINLDKSGDLSDTAHTVTSSGAESNLDIKSEKTIKSISKQNSPSNRSINSEIISTNRSTYTSEFESPESPKPCSPEKMPNTSPIHTDVLQSEADKSKSTLHEIMQNISNITDEISTIYKLSFANSPKSQTENNDKDGLSSVQHISNNLQSDIVKSLSELIKTQSSCQDIRSLRESIIIETPEPVGPKNKLNESRSTSGFQANLFELDAEGNNRKESDKKDDFVSIVNDAGSDIVEMVERGVDDAKQDDEERATLSELSSLNESSDHCSEESNNLLNVSAKSAQAILDLSYGFVPYNSKQQTSVADQNHLQEDTRNNLKQQLSLPNHLEEHVQKNFEQHTNVSDQDHLQEPIHKSLEQQLSACDQNQLQEHMQKDSEQPTSVSNQNHLWEHVNNSVSEFLEQQSDVSIENEATTSAAIEDSRNNFEILENSTVNSLQCQQSESKIDDDVESNKITEEDLIEANSVATSPSLEDVELHKAVDDESPLEIVHTIEDNAVETEENTDGITEDDFKQDFDSKAIETKEETTPSDVEKLTVDLLHSESVTSDLEEEKDDTASVTRNDSDNAVIDVKKRVMEILADANSSSPRESKSPRLQDIYTTTYDVTSPNLSPETGSPGDTERGLISATQLYGEEAEALFKKQLAIEQEIKQLEQQQKEQLPYLYMREIPNKPPPPYTPPSATQLQTSVVPLSEEQVDVMTGDITDVLYMAYDGGYLQSSFSPPSKLLSKNNINKECYEFVFDLCRELAMNHYKQFAEDDRPSWLKVAKKSQVAESRPHDRVGLKRYLDKKIKELFGFQKVQCKENAIIKWSRKKRDHVDELLVLESQTEESEWTNYNDDEIIVKQEVTNDIMNMLLQDTANVMSMVLRKKTFQY